MSAMSTSEPVLPLWKKLLFSAILLVILVGFAEIGSRWYLRTFQGYSGGPLLQYEFDPYKNVRPTRGFVDTRGLQHNSQGFRRSEDVSMEKPAGTYRIFLMGGSTAYGTGGLWPHLQKEYAVLDNQETIDAYLERGLSEAMPGTRIEVINAAIPSIWTHHHLIYLNQTILSYDPDMVVFVDGYNDFYHSAPDHDQFASYAYKEHAYVIMGEPTVQALAYANVWWFGRKSAFAHLLFRQARVVKQLLSPAPEQQPMEVERNLANLQEVYPNNALEMVDRTAALLQHEGVRGVFVLQPMLILEREREMPEIERKLFEFNVESYLPNYEEYMRGAVPLVREMEKSVVEANGGMFIDATPIYRGQQGQMFTDYVHLTPEANELLAGRIQQEIEPIVRAEAPGAFDGAMTMRAN